MLFLLILKDGSKKIPSQFHEKKNKLIKKLNQKIQ